MKKVLIYLLFGILLLIYSLIIFVSITMGIIAFACAETITDIFWGLLFFVLSFLGICDFGKMAYDSCKLEKIERK